MTWRLLRSGETIMEGDELLLEDCSWGVVTWHVVGMPCNHGYSAIRRKVLYEEGGSDGG